MATIRGTSRGDELTGTLEADLILGFGGHDEISGRAGDDRLYGHAGDDEIGGGLGNDRVSGGDGDDEIDGDGGNDRLAGGNGDDEIDGGSGRDSLFGGAGNDELDGGSGNDRLSGGRGRDTLDGGSGDDLLFGGTGADVFEFDERDGSDIVADFVDGSDRISLDDDLGFSSIAQVLARALRRDRNDRFGSAREMVTAIDGYIEPKTVREPRAEAMRAGPSRTAPVTPVVQPETQQMGPATVLQPAVTTPLKPQPAATVAAPKPAAARAPAPKQGNLLKALLRIGLLALVVAGIIWGVVRLIRGSGEQSQPAPAAVAQQLGGTQGMIEGDLARAERLIAEKKWFAPDEDNALKRINSARQAKASETRVNELTRKLAESVAAEVLVLRKDGDAARAAALVAEARRQLPDEPALRAL